MIADVAAPKAGHRYVAGYRLKQVLGRGRRSTVYLALDRQRSRTVALKVAQRAHLDDCGAAGDFGREFAMMDAIHHRHVVEVYAHGISGDQAFLAMEHAGGGAVAPHCGRLGSARTVSLLRQAAAALGSIHRHGWVHRDVKPANLLLRLDGSLALCDFGCARCNGERDAVRPGLVVGTLRYAAPEQSQGAAADPTADVYSLGACLYEMLTGKPLRPGETPTEVFSQHLLAPVPQLAGGYAAWQPLLDALLAKEPRQRLADGQAVLLQLQREERFHFLSGGSKDLS